MNTQTTTGYNGWNTYETWMANMMIGNIPWIYHRVEELKSDEDWKENPTIEEVQDYLSEYWDMDGYNWNGIDWEEILETLIDE